MKCGSEIESVVQIETGSLVLLVLSLFLFFSFLFYCSSCTHPRFQELYYDKKITFTGKAETRFIH